jgi:allantoinase
MTELDLVVHARRVISTAGEVARSVGVKDGSVVAIEPLGSGLTAPRVLELAEDEVLMPGVVDSHVHVNDPGRTEWEGFASATRAAAAGGVTTLVDMPLNSIPPTVDVDALELKIVHAEDSHAIDHAPTAHGESYRGFLESRPRGAENLAIAQVIELARWTGCRVHILHVSSSDALPMIASARREGVQITAETCPHYLTFTAEEIPDGATQFKCCPPIRESGNRELLWEGLRSGVIDMVVSDHSPSTVDLKCLDIGDFGVAWGGISSLQLGLSAVWTQARQRGFTLVDVARWMCQAPARQTGLRHKGRIEIGYDADLCVFAPDDAFVVDVEKLHHKNAITPYSGRPLAGTVRSALLRGERIDIEDEPRGRLLTRGGA